MRWKYMYKQPTKVKAKKSCKRLEKKYGACRIYRIKVNGKRAYGIYRKVGR